MKITVELNVPAKLVKAAQPMARRFGLGLEEFIMFHAGHALSVIEGAVDDPALTRYYYVFPDRDAAIRQAKDELSESKRKRTEDCYSYRRHGKVEREFFTAEEVGLCA